MLRCNSTNLLYVLWGEIIKTSTLTEAQAPWAGAVPLPAAGRCGIPWRDHWHCRVGGVWATSGRRQPSVTVHPLRFMPLCLVFAQKGELTGTDAETFPFELYSGVLSNFPHFFAFPDGICSGPLACPSANIRTAPCQQAASCIAQAAFRRALPIFFCGTKIKQHLGKGSQAWSVLGPATAGAIPGLSKAFHKGGAPG